MKAIFTVLVLLILSFTALGNERPDKQLAIEFLQISRTEQTVNTTLDTFSQQFMKQLPLENRKELDKLMRQTMGWDVIKNPLAEIVMGIYTTAELKAAIIFMKSPLGASFTAKNDPFSAQFASLITANMTKFMQENPLPANTTAK